MRMMTVLMVASVAALGGSVVAQSVTYDFDSAADFSKFKSYTWVRGTNLDNELNHRRIVRAVDAQLAAKGLGPSDGAVADVLVAYHATFDKDLQITGFSSGFGGCRFGAMRSGSATVDEILVGTLVVDIVDAKTKSIVWRGAATKELDPKANPEKRDKNINKAAEKLFRNYPPR